MSLDFQIKGLKKLDRLLAQKLPTVGKSAAGLAAVREGQKIILADMKKRASVHKDSGATLATLGRRAKKHKNGKGIIGFVGSYHEKRRAVSIAQDAGRKIKGIFYPRFMEFGTKNQAAQPFIRPSLKNNTRTVTAAVVKSLRKAVRRASK